MTWLIIAILVALTIGVLTEKGEFGWTLTSLVVFLAVYYVFTKDLTFKGSITWIADNWIMFICFVFLYITAGVFWALLKWKWYCTKVFRKFNVPERDATWYLSVRSNKGRITAWMMWWPLSLGWWLVNDPITRLYNYIYERLVHLFESIRESALKEATKKPE